MIACIIYFGCNLAKSNSTTTHGNGISIDRLENVIVKPGVNSTEKKYTGFTVNFNPGNRTPNTVAWILHHEETDGATARSNKFWTDEDLEGCADTKDYVRSGYDRGHMCPAGEQKWSDNAMHDSFVMANICPQKHDLNSGAWKTLEERERLWARRDSILVIVAGPIYNSTRPETIGKNEVAVPDAFFKVILAPFANPARAIGFVFPNEKCPGNMANYSTTVDEVERITGHDFFQSLPDDIETAVESATSFKEWNQY
mgnify:CR=1 FL=1